MSNIVDPFLVPRDIKTFAEENVKKSFSIACAKLKMNLSFHGVSFFQRSTTAGYVIPRRDNVVYLNLELLKRNKDFFEKDTIPHEVAHLFADKIATFAERPHGKTWKKIMKNVFGIEPKRCHSLNTEGVGKRVKKYKYICKCQKHEMSSVAHKKMQAKKATYRCRKCYSTLTYLCDL